MKYYYNATNNTWGETSDLSFTDIDPASVEKPSHYIFGPTLSEVIDSERDDVRENYICPTCEDYHRSIQGIVEPVQDLLNATTLFDIFGGQTCYFCDLTGQHSKQCVGLALEEGLDLAFDVL